jgi:hypothetical protein
MSSCEILGGGVDSAADILGQKPAKNKDIMAIFERMNTIGFIFICRITKSLN